MKRAFIVAAAVLLFLSATTASAGCYSEGVRKGEIQKFSAKGLVNVSWEGEMVQEGMRVRAKGNGAGVTNIWKFSVTDPVVAKKIENAMFTSSGSVAVRYCQSAFNTGLFQGTSYTVTDVMVQK
jgi:hypothetical protein